MGKGTILSGGLDGLYQVRMEFDRKRVDDRITAIDERLESDLELVQALNAVNDAKGDVDQFGEQLDRALKGWETLQIWEDQQDYPTGADQGNQVLIQFGISAVVELPGRSGDVQPDWGSIGDDQTLRENAVTWSMSIEDQTGGAFWSPSTDYSIGERVLAIPNIIVEMELKNVYATASVAGRSGFSQPGWPNSGSVIDGGIIWRRRNQTEELQRLVEKLAEASAKLASAQQRYDTLKMEREALRREKEYLEENTPEEPELSAWCADITENLAPDTEVGTMEIPGERAGVPVLVRPAYIDAEQEMAGAAYDTLRDGGIQPSIASTAAGVFWNLAVLPGWQRWRPQYRLGRIHNIDLEFGICDVELDPATSSQQGLDVNHPNGLFLQDVPVVYMNCGAAAFLDDDRVVVEFTDRDWTKPRVIGFESNPKRCPVGQFTFLWNVALGNNDDRLFRGAPGNWKMLDLEDGLASGLNSRSRLSIWSSMDKTLILTASALRDVHQGVDKIATTPNLIIAAGLNTHADETVWLRCVNYVAGTFICFEAPYPVAAPASTAIFDQGTYDALVAAEDEPGAAAEWAKWHPLGSTITITDHTGGADPGIITTRLRLGSINASGTTAAMMVGFINPNTFIVPNPLTGGDTVQSDWHGYFKITFDPFSVEASQQDASGDNAAHLSQDISATLSVETPPSLYGAETLFVCPPRDSWERATVNQSSSESQHAGIVLDLAYEGDTLMLGELRVDYEYSEQNSGSYSREGQQNYEPDASGSPCIATTSTSSATMSGSGSQDADYDIKLRIRPENSESTVFEAIVEDFERHGSYSVGGDSTDTGNGVIGYIEYFSVLHRAAIIRRSTRTDASSEDDVLVMCVPGHEQALCDPTIGGPNMPVFARYGTGLQNFFVRDEGAFKFPPIGAPCFPVDAGPSGQILNGDYSWICPTFEADIEEIVSHFPNDGKNHHHWADQIGIDANVRWFNGSSMFSIHKLNPQIWPVIGINPDPDRFDTSVRYNHLTGGDPAALLEAEEEPLRLQQIGIL